MVENSNTQLAISVPRYEGPFDLLLALIRRNEYPIDALPVPAITGQFLAYVRSAPDLDQELAAEFIEVATWLVLLKSRSMLPHQADDGPLPHEELRRAVLDHQTLRQATEFLGGRAGRSRPGAAGAPVGHEESEVDGDQRPTVDDVIEMLRRAMESSRAAASIGMTESLVLTVEEQKAWVLEKLALHPTGTPFAATPWFDAQAAIKSRASLFLALLELGRNGNILLNQHCDFGNIYIKKLSKSDERKQEITYSQAV